VNKEHQDLYTELFRLESEILSWSQPELLDQARFDDVCNRRTEVELDIELWEEYQRPIR
jgi:hypothetical protein